MEREKEGRKEREWRRVRKAERRQGCEKMLREAEGDGTSMTSTTEIRHRHVGALLKFTGRETNTRDA